MPDLDPLPCRPGVPSFAPRPEDFAAIVGRAKNRRRRQAGVAGGLAGVAVVLAVAVGGGPGSVGLRPVDPTTGGPATSASAAATPSPSPSASARAEPRAAARPGGGPAEKAPQAAGPGRRPETGRPVPPEDGRPPATVAPPAGVARPVFVRDEIEDTSDVCDPDDPVTPSGWCVRYQGPAVVKAGDVHAYRVLACRQLGRGGDTLEFGSEQQIDLVVWSATREEWRWSRGYDFARKPTSVFVAERRCARWTVRWDATGPDGYPLRPGHYDVTPVVDAEVWANNTDVAQPSYALEITE